MPVPKRTASGPRRTASSGIGLEEVGQDVMNLPVVDRGHMAAAPKRAECAGKPVEQWQGGGGDRREPVVRAVDEQDGARTVARASGPSVRSRTQRSRGAGNSGAKAARRAASRRARARHVVGDEPGVVKERPSIRARAVAAGARGPERIERRRQRMAAPIDATPQPGRRAPGRGGERQRDGAAHRVPATA